MARGATSSVRGDDQEVVRRQRSPRGQGSRLRLELIDAATRLLEVSGDARVLTLASVAREVGIATPSIYRHFSDLGSLVEAVVSDSFQRLDDALVAAMELAKGPPGRLRACCTAYCGFALENPGQYHVLFNAYLGLDPDRPGERPGERVFDRLVGAVAACTEAGVGRQEAPHLMAVHVWVALHGIVSLMTSRPNHAWPPLDELIEATLTGQVGLHGR
jgi:AcrR family transcriptional regulator